MKTLQSLDYSIRINIPCGNHHEAAASFTSMILIYIAVELAHPFLKSVNRAGNVFFLAKSPLAPRTTTDKTSLLAIKHFTSSLVDAEAEHGRYFALFSGGISLCPFNPRAPKRLLIFSTLSLI